MPSAALSKTNAARLLDSLGIAYTLHAVAVQEDDLSATSVARDLNVLPSAVYKTLVARTDKGLVFMVCIMADATLHLKKTAKALHAKSINLVPLKEVLPLTGYIRGGCSPLAAKKKYPVFLDENAILEEYIYINAGQRGLQLRLKPDHLLQAVQGQWADLIITT